MKLNKTEERIWNAMRKLSNINEVVEITQNEVSRKAGYANRTNANCASAFRVLEILGYIKKVGRCKWLILK